MLVLIDRLRVLCVDRRMVFESETCEAVQFHVISRSAWYEAEHAVGRVSWCRVISVPIAGHRNDIGYAIAASASLATCGRATLRGARSMGSDTYSLRIAS